MERGSTNAKWRLARSATPLILTPLLAGVLIVSLFSSAQSTVVLNPMGKPVPNSYFNLNILFHPATTVPWPAAPFYSWRVWHALWPDLEPQKGEWNFALLDKYADWATQHHTEMLMILAYTPQWASSNPDAGASWYKGASGPPRDEEDWRDFVRTVGNRYKGRIHAYEVWNEPDRPQDWGGDVETMVGMVRDASSILKGIDPKALIVSPSAEQQKGVPWLNEFLAKGGANYVDVIGYHFYVPNSSPEAMVPLIQKVKAVMHNNGVGEKPLWDTEAGWLGTEPLPDDQAMAYVTRAFILNWAARVDRFYWYAWDDHHGNQIELTQKSNATLRPAGKAFETIQQWLVGSAMKECSTSDGQTWVCELDSNGALRYIVWSVAERKDFRISSTWRVKQATGLDGSRSEIAGGSISIGPQPVLVE